MPRRPPPQRILATVLFTDIVGSTERAAELGDKGWRQLIARHHAIVRRELKRFDGREIDTAGDGFFATFGQPLDAILCATAVAERLRPLGIAIRAGVHMGQVEVAQQKVQGLAVNIGARVAAKASGHQILVSSTVRDALAGAEVRFDQEGTFELKGVPGTWELFSVVKDEALLVESGAPAATGLSPEAAAEAELTEGRARRWTVPVVVGVLVIIAGGGLLAWRASHASDFTPAPDTLLALDADGSVAGGTPVGRDPSVIGSGDGEVWVGSTVDRTIQQVDPDTLKVIGQQGLDTDASPSSIAVGGGYVWVASSAGQLTYRIRPQTNEVRKVDVDATAVAWGEGAAWVSSYNAGTVTRIEPETLTPQVFPLPAGSGPRGLAVGEGTAWIADTLKQRILKMDLASGEVAPVNLSVSGGPEDAVLGLGYLWVTVPSADVVVRIDTASGQGTTIEVGDDPFGIAVASDAVWVTNRGSGTVSRIDPNTASVDATTTVGFRPTGIAAIDDRVFVGLSD